MSDTPATIESFRCPSCGANSFTPTRHNSLVCNYCNSAFRIQDTICHNCTTVNSAAALYCTHCSEELKRICPVCQHTNTHDAEYCANCNHVLDILAFITQRYKDSADGYVVTQSAALVDIKKQDAEFLAAQSAEFDERERQRQVALIAQRAAHLKEQRRIRQLVVGIGVVIVIVLLVIAVLLLPGAGGG